MMLPDMVKEMYLVLMVMNNDPGGNMTMKQVIQEPCGSIEYCCARAQEAETNTVMTSMYIILNNGRAEMMDCANACRGWVPPSALSPDVKWDVTPVMPNVPAITDPNTVASPS